MISKGRYFVLALLLAASAQTMNASVIKFIDMESLLGDIQADFQAMQTTISKEFQSSVETLGKKKQDLEAKMNDVRDKEAHKAKIGAVDSEIQAKAQAAQAKMAGEQKKAQQRAETRMKKIETVRAKHGWHAVVPTGSTVAHDKAHDVTAIVKKECNLPARK